MTVLRVVSVGSAGATCNGGLSSSIDDYPISVAIDASATTRPRYNPLLPLPLPLPPSTKAEELRLCCCGDDRPTPPSTSCSPGRPINSDNNHPTVCQQSPNKYLLVWLSFSPGDHSLHLRKCAPHSAVANAGCNLQRSSPPDLDPQNPWKSKVAEKRARRWRRYEDK
jgi:hypothetical protein